MITSTSFEAILRIFCQSVGQGICRRAEMRLARQLSAIP